MHAKLSSLAKDGLSIPKIGEIADAAATKRAIAERRRRNRRRKADETLSPAEGKEHASHSPCALFLLALKGLA